MLKSGFLLINKPSGPTSHDIIDILRDITGIKKIGHAGTLDPIANGLLIVAIGREATRKIASFVKLDKTYIAELHLGATSDTYDAMGKIKQSFHPIIPAKAGILKILQKFEGEQKQIPPMYSAKKIKGKKLYELARQGKEVKREPTIINIYNIKLLNYKWPILKAETRVSSGTYIRSLANDIGQAFGCGAYLEGLQRTKIGNYDLKNSVDIEKLNENNWKKYLI